MRRAAGHGVAVAPVAGPSFYSHPRTKRDGTCLSTDVAYPSCNNVGNDLHSCFPTAGTVVLQDTWTKLIWNPNLPQFTQLGFVDVYLYSDDAQIIVQSWKDLTTGQGELGACANDTWLSISGSAYTSHNLTWHFYFVIVPSNTTLTGAEHREPVFDVLQFAPLDSIVTASSAAAASAASSASEASSLSSKSSAAPTASGGPGSGNLQGNSPGDNPFPNWAIALLTVLGLLSLLAFALLALLFIRERRSRRRRLHRESMGSESPMMAAVPQSPLTSPYTANPGSVTAAGTSYPRSAKGPDRASSTTSGGHSADGPFSGAEAAFMADAFRNALRKPDFADRPVEEGESPDAAPPKDPDHEVLLSRELAEEGRDIRSVRSVRGVRVETMSDSEEAGT